MQEERNDGTMLVIAYLMVAFSGFTMGLLAGWLWWG